MTIKVGDNEMKSIEKLLEEKFDLTQKKINIISQRLDYDIDDEKNIINIGKRKSEYGDYYIGGGEYLILGKKILASKRKIYPHSSDDEWISGSIGFLDFIQKNDIIVVSIFGIEPEYQGKCYGNKFIKKIEEIAKDRNVKKIKFIAVEKDNERMIKLLKSFGYYETRGYNPEIFVKDIV